MNEELIKKLKELAKSECWDDNMNDDSIVDDFAGGNVDDAYWGGEHTGRVKLARETLDSLGIIWRDDK